MICGLLHQLCVTSCLMTSKFKTSHLPTQGSRNRKTTTENSEEERTENTAPSSYPSPLHRKNKDASRRPVSPSAAQQPSPALWGTSLSMVLHGHIQGGNAVVSSLLGDGTAFVTCLLLEQFWGVTRVVVSECQQVPTAEGLA